ncbi:hypothetical protein MAJ_10771, partial [Metarhizium majus ARSEF 297]
MELPQEHVNPQALANVFTCTLPVLPSSSPMRPRAVELGPEAAPRRLLSTSPKRRRANTNPSSPRVGSQEYTIPRRTHSKSSKPMWAKSRRPTIAPWLALAVSEKYDIVLLQEPWTEAKNSRCLTKTHPAYDTYSPVDSWDSNGTWPRVMTYIRKDSRIFADQKRPTFARDIL